MGSTFNIYNIATTGMYVNQASLSVVSNNLSNITTPGYSRQQIASAEKIIGGTPYGCGAGVNEICRARDSFLDQTYRQVNGKTSYYNRKYALLEDGQKLLNEYGNYDNSTSSSKGLQQTIKNFFDSWDQLSNDAGSQSTRSTIVGYATALVNTFNQINTQLTEMQQDAGNRVNDSVDSLNNGAQDLVALNKEIMLAENNGGENGNLRDQRDALLDKMSSLANISVAEQPNGALNVSIGGVTLVQGDMTHTLTVVETGTTLQVKWAELDMDAGISSGTIRADLEEADQSAAKFLTGEATYNFVPQSSSTLTDLRQGLNNLMTTIANKVNSLLQSGKDLYGNSGEALFVKINSNASLGLGNIQLNPAVASDMNKIAAGTSGAKSDYTVAAKITGLQNEKMFSSDGLSMTGTDFYQSLLSWISTMGNTAGSNYDTQGTLRVQVGTQRDSISSVSQDEEMSKMIIYQTAYNASARVLSTADTLISDLIKQLGR
ncbi:flagellar hook-associated protein 1 FlgK [Sporomusaceae bacterium BoRhaA]|uniref:flagellar hook-associated protein FlgK n=1 Tax=Pelorhabdus rhamnosifermentans TaxID=2772457 RepID=UPI001C063FA2|nr:flagellar hook-associated protein FlgK [Pelorhabdus rhamnosifermentans]MBU2703568.1 flagellar hook-associated protein 1 FlgK [Pelorhabdus rhamnosifermentans]